MPLTKKERAIMDVLEKAHGKIVSRDEIAKRVYGEQHLNSNLVDAHVRNIRSKLGQVSIRSVRGEGYAIYLSLCCNAPMVNGGVQCEACGSPGI